MINQTRSSEGRAFSQALFHKYYLYVSDISMKYVNIVHYMYKYTKSRRIIVMMMTHISDTTNRCQGKTNLFLLFVHDLIDSKIPLVL